MHEVPPEDVRGRSGGEALRDRRRRGYVAVFLSSAMLLGALAALPWHHYAISVTGVPSFSFDRSGLESPDAALGIAALIVAAVMVVFSAAAVVGPPRLLATLQRADQLLAVLGVGLAALLVLKVLADTDFLGIGAWISLVLGVVSAGGSLTARTRRP